MHGVDLLTQGDLIDAIDDPQEGWQFGENITTGKSVWMAKVYQFHNDYYIINSCADPDGFLCSL